MTKLSIIVPVYNAQASLARCIESVLKQDFTDWELLLIDDGSHDDSPKIMDDYAASDSRIKAVHKTNSGVSATRNRALAMAKGRYIQFMDADDWLALEASKLLVRAMGSGQTDMVVADFYRVVGENVSKKGSISKACVLSRNDYADEMMKSPADFYYGVLWNKLYKKSIIDRYALRMDENVCYCEDLLFNMEYLLHVRSVAVLKVPVYYYVKTEGSLVEKSMNVPALIQMKRNVITYYNDFYKSILTESDYRKRMPIIYGFLLAVGSDSITMPFINSFKLGNETGKPVYIDERTQDTVIGRCYMAYSLLDRYLFTVAEQFKLDRTDIRILYCLFISDGQITLAQIEAYTGISRLTVSTYLVKLTAQQYISKKKEIVEDESMSRYTIISAKISQAIANMQTDYERVCFSGLTAPQIDEFKASQQIIYQNIAKLLK